MTGLERGWRWLKLRRPAELWLAAVLLLICAAWPLSFALRWYSAEVVSSNGVRTRPHAEIVNPIVAFLGGAFLAWAAVQQARTATRRHYAQVEADRKRRFSESYSNAVTQLASDKTEERLGGIYTLEQISKESEDDYWTVMETLTAFIRERTRRTEAERTSTPFEQRVEERAYFLWQNAGRPEGRSEEFRNEAIRLEKLGEPPPTDIAAVLTVIDRRNEKDQNRERDKGWRLDFHDAVLRRADLSGMHLGLAKFFGAHLEDAKLEGAHLEWANFGGAHLEGATLQGAHLQGADLQGAHLQGASLFRTHLEGATLFGTHFEGTSLLGTYLKGALLYKAHLEGTHLKGVSLLGVHLEGADLRCAIGLKDDQLVEAYGDGNTRLPEYIKNRPAHWPPEAPEESEA
ncbi:MAG: pentapeptide repeat-containing protein [Acetobacteraceae bacterium]|nr:pentapeptide repeat-containing protein [Acetobacteraceae bacterium]